MSKQENVQFWIGKQCSVSVSLKPSSLLSGKTVCFRHVKMPEYKNPSVVILPHGKLKGNERGGAWYKL